MTTRTIALTLCFLTALWPQALWSVRRISEQGGEPLSLLAIGTFGLLAWRQRAQFSGNLRRGLSALFVTVVASFSLPPLLVAGIALLAIALVSGLIRSPGLFGLLLLTLPLMASVNFYLAWPVRLLVATSAEFLLAVGGLPVTREGTLLLFRESEVGVDPPCSGIRMLWFTAFLLCALSVLHSLSWKKFLLLAPSALLLSLLANIGRSTVLFFPESGIVEWPDWTHPAVGLSLHLLVALSLHFLLTRTTTQTNTTICSRHHPSSSSEPVSA